MDVSFLILARDEADNLASLLPAIKGVISKYDIEYEIVVIDGKSSDNGALIALQHGARVMSQLFNGYGEAFRLGIVAVRGTYTVTLDADWSHGPEVIDLLLTTNQDTDVLIASRYLSRSSFQSSYFRKNLSILLSGIVRMLFNVPIYDCSSGFRRYRTDRIKEFPLHGKDFDVLVELLVLAKRRGYSLQEIPLHYIERRSGISKVRLARFAKSYLITTLRLIFRI